MEEKTVKITLKFDVSERDILLHKHYSKILDGLEKELGHKISVANGTLHRAYHREAKKWREVIYNDLIIICSPDVKDRVLKAVA